MRDNGSQAGIDKEMWSGIGVALPEDDTPGNSASGQYFLMPLTFLQECEDSAGIHRNSLEWDRNPLEWDRNPLEWDWNPPESTGMKLDSTGITIFLQE